MSSDVYLVELRPNDGKIVGRTRLASQGSPTGVAFDGANVWVADYNIGKISKF